MPEHHDTRAPHDTIRKPDDLDLEEAAALGAFLREHKVDYTYTPLGRAALKVEQQRAWLEAQAAEVGDPGVYCSCYAQGLDPRTTAVRCVYAGVHAAGLKAVGAPGPAPDLSPLGPECDGDEKAGR